MYRNQRLGIIQRQINCNMQSSLRDDSKGVKNGKVKECVDHKLATIIYHFLKGNIEGLPKYEYIEMLLDTVDHKIGIISTGCGVTVTKELKIDIETPIYENNEIHRRDFINKDGYNAYKLIVEDYINQFNKKDKRNVVVDINTDKEPRFQPERIERLIKYLNNFYRRKNPQENQKHM